CRASRSAASGAGAAPSECESPTASRVPRPSPSGRLLLRPGRTPWTTPRPPTAANGLRLRTRGRSRSPLLRCLLGNRLRRATGTAGTPLPAPFAATTTTVRRLLPSGDAFEQRVDRGADFLLNHVADHRHQAPL